MYQCVVAGNNEQVRSNENNKQFNRYGVAVTK